MEALTIYFVQALEKPFTKKDGTVIPAGTDVLMSPHTSSKTVWLPGGKNLHVEWPKVQALLSDYQTQLIKNTDRLTKLELWAAQNGYDIQAVQAAQE